MNMDKKKVTFKNPHEINEKKNLYTQNKNKKISNKKIEHFAKLLGVKTSGGHRVEEKIYINEYHKFFEANVEVKGNSEGNEFNIDLRYLNFRQAEAVLTALKSIK